MNVLSLFLFYQSIALSSRTVDGMYFVGSAVGKASTIGIEISPNPHLILTEMVKKCEIRSRF